MKAASAAYFGNVMETSEGTQNDVRLGNILEMTTITEDEIDNWCRG